MAVFIENVMIWNGENRKTQGKQKQYNPMQ